MQFAPRMSTIPQFVSTICYKSSEKTASRILVSLTLNDVKYNKF